MGGEYRVRLLRRDQVCERVCRAGSKDAAVAQIGPDEGVVLDVQRVRPARIAGAAGKRRRISLGLLLQELSALLEAGLALIEALEALSDKAGAGSRQVQAVLADLLRSCTRGNPVEGHAGAAGRIPRLLVATVASAEGSGQLPQALRRYQHYELRIENIRKKVVGALLYPAAVVAVGFGVLMFMLFFVIPRFAVVFESLQSLPATAQALLWWARLVREHGMALGAGIAGVIVAAVLALRTARIRAALAAQLWRLPKLRDVAFCSC